MAEYDNQIASSELIAALRDYLPSPLLRQCISGTEIRNAQACVEHLTALLQAISTYLPRLVVSPSMADPARQQVEGAFTYGTVMFADISGFTAMSEKLSRLGKEGAEEITAIVNRFFTALLQVTDQFGGDLLKFGGDALLLLFGEQGHVTRACIAALQMQQTMARFTQVETSQGTFRLQMTIGLATGPLFVAHLGSEDGELVGFELAVMGPVMAQMAHAEDLASAGQIFVDSETHRALANRGIFGQRQEGFWQLVSLSGKGVADAQPTPTGSDAPRALGASPSAAAQPGGLPQLAYLVRRIQALSAYLPLGLIDKIKLAPERIAVGGEYRPVTVLFANFYGTDQIIRDLGQKRSAEITAILNAHFRTMRRIIAKYGGVVNKVDSYAMGHRIMALFGAPRAHVDDPERAVRAALEMQEAMGAFAELETSGGSFCLKQRIGVNTGLVFAGNVGSITRQEYSVMGDEVNLTARLMSVADEGQVIISQSTARQSGDVFLLHEQEPVRVKGKSQPVHNYQVLGLKERPQPGEGIRRPLVGRDEEWRTIHALSERSWNGETQVLTLVGDVGVGKTRLLEELVVHWTQQHSGVSIGVTCPSFGRHTPYLPWSDALRSLFGFTPADTNQEKMAKIGAGLQSAEPTLGEWVTLIARLLGLNVQESELVRTLDAQARRRAIFRVVVSLIDHAAGRRPLLLAVDDLQWADDTSVALINEVARQVTGRSLLMAVTHRPEETLALKVDGLPSSTVLHLEELSEQASLELLDALLPITPQMPHHLKRMILDKARGNPLFIDAVAHSLIENCLTLDPQTGTYRPRSDLQQIEIPDSVNRVILSRLDRLDESSRNILRVAAAIGQEFEYWLLDAVYPFRQGRAELRDWLDALSERDILIGPYADVIYLFRHILTREVAYESLLYADRHRLHRQIGLSIERQRADRLAEYWEVLAYHFDLAEEWEKAIHYHLQAGRKAQSIYANEDAIHHFRRCLKATDHVSRSQGRQLEAYEHLSEVLATVGDYDEALAHNDQALDLLMAIDVPAAERACRLADLCCMAASIYEKLCDYATAFTWLHGALRVLEGLEAIELAHVYLMGAGIYHRQGKYAEALDWCRKGLTLAQELSTDQARPAVAHAYYLMGLIHSRLGNTDRTVEFCQRSLEIYEQTGDLNKAAEAHINLGVGHFGQGDWGKATEHYLQALDIKRRIGDVYYQGVITLNLVEVYLNQGQLDQATRYGEQSLEIWQQLGSTYAIALLHNNMGMVALRRGEPREALTLLQQSLDMFEQIGSTDFVPEVTRHLAETYLSLGEWGHASHTVHRSLALAQEGDMRLDEGAARRVLGQVHLSRDELSQAEAEFDMSLHLLQGLGSRYQVGQTLVQLALLYRRQRRPAEAATTLARAAGIFETLGASLDLGQARSLQSRSEPSP